MYRTTFYNLCISAIYKKACSVCQYIESSTFNFTVTVDQVLTYDVIFFQ
jgi:hypothetical protein